MKLVVVPASLPTDPERRVLVGVVEEGVRDAGARGKSDEVSLLQRIDLTVNLHRRPPADDKRELLFGLLGVRPARAAAGRQGLPVRADLQQPERRADRRGARDRHDADAERMGEAGRNPTSGFYLLTTAIARTADEQS